MKRTITNKIILFNLMIILLTLAIVGAVFSFSVKRFMERQATATLVEDAQYIAEIFKRDPAGSRETENNIRQILKNRLKSTLELAKLESKWAVIGKMGNVVYPLDKSQAEIVETNLLPQLQTKFSLKKPSTAGITLDGAEYMAAVIPVKDAASLKLKGWVLLYAEVGPVRQLTRGLFLVLLISLGITALIGLAFGITFARKIARPVILLKKRAEKLSRRDFDSRVEIRTGDELEDLADTIDNMALELKEYHSAQKKFLQNASHELKTPLMSIQGYAEGLKDGVFEDEKKALDVIIEESTRLKVLVEELIFLSKLETMEDFYHFEPLDLNVILLKSAEKINGLALKSSISIAVPEPAENLHVRVDGDKLIQALINILSNCIRYARNQVSISARKEGEYAVVTVADDGDGFEPGEAREVFKRFYKGKKGNTGLGLAITKAIVEKHGGSVEAKNAGDPANRGTDGNRINGGDSWNIGDAGNIRNPGNMGNPGGKDSPADMNGALNGAVFVIRLPLG